MSPSDEFLERLHQGERLTLDGAIGTELQRRGAPMDSVAWCAVATRTHPDVLEQIHLDYIEAGADIITANTFSTARHVLESAGLGDETETINRTAVYVARQAADEASADGVFVAGSISSMGPLTGPESSPTDDDAAASYAEQARLLAEAGADLLIAEMMSDMDNTTLIIEAAKSVELPLMVGWSASFDDQGNVVPYGADRHPERQGLSFEELIRRGSDLGGDVAGVMHSNIDVTGPALEVLRGIWGGPLMAYAETGRFEPPNWVFEDVATPAAYAAIGREWADAGVQIIGGCCGTTPEHIAALKDALRD